MLKLKEETQIVIRSWFNATNVVFARLLGIGAPNDTDLETAVERFIALCDTLERRAGTYYSMTDLVVYGDDIIKILRQEVEEYSTAWNTLCCEFERAVCKDIAKAYIETGYSVPVMVKLVGGIK